MGSQQRLARHGQGSRNSLGKVFSPPSSGHVCWWDRHRVFWADSEKQRCLSHMSQQRCLLYLPGRGSWAVSAHWVQQMNPRARGFHSRWKSHISEERALPLTHPPAREREQSNFWSDLASLPTPTPSPGSPEIFRGLESKPKDRTFRL